MALPRRVYSASAQFTTWKEPGLPSLSGKDQRRLLTAKSLLTWSGRYAAPKTDHQFYRERAAYDALGPEELLYRNIWKWESFDRLYQLPSTERIGLVRTTQRHRRC